MATSGSVMQSVEGEGVVDVINGQGMGGFLFTCEHASNFIPKEYNNLHLDEEALGSHIAWDPGALKLATCLSEELDSPVVAPKISRLIFDVNRPLGSPTAMPAQSDHWRIAGNENLSLEEQTRRHDLYYVPYHEKIEEMIAQEACRAFVTIHSFTPVFKNTKRDVEIGVLHDVDSRLADYLLEYTESEGSYVVRRNEPYGIEDGVTHTLQKHAIKRGLPNVMIEIRNDLLKSKADRREICQWLTKKLSMCLARMQAE